MAATLKVTSPFVLLAVVLAIAMPAILPRTDGHDLKHALDRVTSAQVLSKVQSCETEKYYSARYNTFLLLTECDNTSLIGGLIMGAMTGNQLTAFAAPRDHWNQVIVRDGYTRVP